MGDVEPTGTGFSSRPLSAVVLAAGEGTRMRSTRPKPLHLLCGRAMLLYVIDSLAQCDMRRVIVVVGHGAERVTKKLQEEAPAATLSFVEQHVQRGTGDAVSVGLTAIPSDEMDAFDGDIIVLPGDTPLLRSSTIAQLVETHRETGSACTLLTARMEDPTGYGRVVRGKDGRVSRIVEHSDATEEEREIDEVCTSIYCFRAAELAPALRRLSPQNAQGEYYLTDVVSVLHDAGYPVASVVVDDPGETRGVNDRLQLSVAEAELRDRTNCRWMRDGVTMVDPATTFVDASVLLAPDVTLFPGTVLQGSCVIGTGARIGPATHLVDCEVGPFAAVQHSTGTGAVIGEGARVGPYAVLGPGSEIPADTITGPFHHAAGFDHDA